MKPIDLFNVPYVLEGVWHLIAHPVSQTAKEFCQSCACGVWINDALLVSGEGNLSSFLQSIPDTLATITM